MTNDRKARAERAEQMRKEREKADRRQRNLISIGIVAIVIVLIGVAAVAINQTSKSNERATEVVEPRNIVDGGAVYEPTTEVEGDTEPVLVEAYEDFLCPGCGQFEAMVGPWLKQQAEEGRITLSFRPYSFLDDLGGSSNEYSRRAMNIAMCALDEQGSAAFYSVKDALFAAQPSEGGNGPENDALLATAKDAGVTVSESCVRTGKFIPWIDAEREKAQEEREVSGTPTVFVDGEEVSGPVGENGRGTIPGIEDIDKAITAAAS